MCVCEFLLKRHRLLFFIMFSSVLPFFACASMTPNGSMSVKIAK